MKPISNNYLKLYTPFGLNFTSLTTGDYSTNKDFSGSTFVDILGFKKINCPVDECLLEVNA